MYYDNNVFRNLLGDRVARLANGQFNAQANDPCASHGVVIFPGNVAQSAAGLCGQPIGNVATAIADLQTAFQAANAALTSSSPNPSYVGQALNSQQGLLAPTYQTPRSLQMNIGLQKQFWQTTLFSVDYVRNVGTHYLIGYDTNHVGDASHLNTNAALNAINNTLAANPLSAACAPAGSAGASSQTAVSCYLAAVPGASITDFAANGLDSGAQFLGGAPASLFGLTPDTGAAFAGINPLVGRNTMFFPAGRSLYSGLQVSIAHSRHQSGAWSGRRDLAVFLHPRQLSQQPCGRARRSGPAAPGGGFQPSRPRTLALHRRTASTSFPLGSVLDLPRGIRLGLMAQLASPLPQSSFPSRQWRSRRRDFPY